MAIQLERHLFTLEEYERMVEAGVFDEDARVELIRGEIADMAPINFPHEACVARLNTLFVTRTVGKAYVWPQSNSLRIPPSYSRPQPDLTLLEWREDLYALEPPLVKEMLLVVEVSDTTLRSDRNVKGPLYAEAGISEYWIINLQDDVIELYADPVEGAYRRTAKAKRGETITLLTLPDLLKDDVEVSYILGLKVAGS